MHTQPPRRFFWCFPCLTTLCARIQSGGITAQRVLAQWGAVHTPLCLPTSCLIGISLSPAILTPHTPSLPLTWSRLSVHPARPCLTCGVMWLSHVTWCAASVLWLRVLGHAGGHPRSWAGGRRPSRAACAHHGCRGAQLLAYIAVSIRRGGLIHGRRLCCGDGSHVGPARLGGQASSRAWPGSCVTVCRPLLFLRSACGSWPHRSPVSASWRPRGIRPAENGSQWGLPSAL